MARGEIFTVRVESIAAGGAGLARLMGKSVFIELTAPGDLVRGRIIKEHKNWAEAELLEIAEASPQRISPACPLYGRCGACSLQHLNYETQIEAKTAILRSAFTRIGGLAPPEIRVRRSAPWEYRNRVQFHSAETAGRGEDSGGGKNKARFGFRERKSSRVVTLSDCPVAESGIRRILKEGSLSPPAGKPKFTVYSRGDTLLYEGGKERGRVFILDRELAVDAGVFFQSNAVMLEKLIADLIAAASSADRSLPLADIYCGVGTFSAFLAGASRENKAFSEIDLVEENRTALTLARENMPPGIKTNFYGLTDTAWAKGPARTKRSHGFMVLDPPRNGLGAPLREYLAAAGPPLIAYVSCDPATLARDSRVLVEGGYMLKELTLYDFYPQTAHIESLALFARGSSAPAASEAAGRNSPEE